MEPNVPNHPEHITARYIQQNYVELYTSDVENRSHYINQAGWYILNSKTLEHLVTILGSDRVVEVFSGTGYLNYWLQYYREPDYVTKAYDSRMYRKYQAAWAKPYAGSKKNAFNVNLKSFDTVIMCWPAYDENHAYRIVRKMKPGQRLIYQGEWWGGCTGNDQFFNYLDDHFIEDLDSSDYLNSVSTSYVGINDNWYVFTKR